MRIVFLMLCLITGMALGAGVTSGIVSTFFNGDVHWKAPVASSGALPGSGNAVGDCREDQSTGFIYCWTGSSWFLSAGGGTAPGGSNTQMQYNSSGSFAGTPRLLDNGTNLGVAGGAILHFNGVSTVPFGIGYNAYPNMAPSHISHSNPYLSFSIVDSGILSGFCMGGVNSGGSGNCILEIDSSGNTYFNDDINAPVGTIGSAHLTVTDSYFTSNTGFNNSSPLFPIDLVSPSNTTTNITTVTITGAPVDPGTTSLTLPANGTVITYTCQGDQSGITTPQGNGLFSPSTTSGTFTDNFSVDSSTGIATEVDNSGTYTCNGTNNYTYSVYAIYVGTTTSGFSAALLNSFASVDNNTGLTCEFSLTWTAPTSGAPVDYYVYNETTGNANYVGNGTTAIIDDGTWSSYSAPTPAGMSYGVISAGGNGNVQQCAGPGPTGFPLALSFVDTGTNSGAVSPVPAGTFASQGGNLDGPVVTLNNIDSQTPLQSKNHTLW